MLFSADQKNPQGSAFYTVQNDDTFYKISKYYSIALDDLIDANPESDPDNLNAGDLLYIPLSLQEVHCPTGAETYTIQDKDTIYKLSQKFNISVSTLLKANPRINPDILLTGQNICIPRLNSRYCNEIYRISFLYPSRWARINALHYEGLDGFFRISAISSMLDIEALSHKEAFHKLKPYGSQPYLESVSVADCEACIVMPSQDQPMEMKKQAALIIKYPNNLIIDSKSYTHLILWMDALHIHEIKNSIAID